MRNNFFLALSTGIAMGLAACAAPESQQATEPAITKAIAVMHPTEGNTVHGIVTFTKEAEGIHIIADLEGLQAGSHGFHIHQYGDCSAPDGTSAGGHFNPMEKPHAGPMEAMRHVGDLGNIVADADGKAHLDWLDTQLSFSGPRSIIGRGVIVHVQEDDLKTQPTGGAGARVACGVIGIAKP